MRNTLLIMGSPSSTIETLANKLSLKIIKPPEEHSSLSDNDFSLSSFQVFLILYQTPWSFLKRKIVDSRKFLNGSKEFGYASKYFLNQWTIEHKKLIRFYRTNSKQSVLVNIEKTDNLKPLYDIFDKRFNIQFDRIPEKNIDLKNLFHSEKNVNLIPLVKTLVPKVADLYIELESSAELFGREPEFTFGNLDKPEENDIELAQQAFLFEHIEILNEENKKLHSNQEELHRVITETKSESDILTSHIYEVQEKLVSQSNLKAKIDSLTLDTKKIAEERDKLKESLNNEIKRLKLENQKLEEERERRIESLNLEIKDLSIENQKLKEDYNQVKMESSNQILENQKLKEDYNQVKMESSNQILENQKLKEDYNQVKMESSNQILENQRLKNECNLIEKSLKKETKKYLEANDEMNLYKNKFQQVQDELEILKIHTHEKTSLYNKIKKDSELIFATAFELRKQLEVSFLKRLWSKITR
jgi:hypothetical protein